jgi:hypothetical protein
MRLFLGLVDDGEVIATINGDGSFHPHGVKTRVLADAEYRSDGTRVGLKGDTVRVPHQLEDATDHAAASKSLSLALVRDLADGRYEIVRSF